ncbi:45775_t:CDS:2, partial [Gigaspora margarita]
IATKETQHQQRRKNAEMDDTEQRTIRTKKIYKKFKYNISQSQDSGAINIEIDETDYQNAATGKNEDKKGAKKSLTTRTI